MVIVVGLNLAYFAYKNGSRPSKDGFFLFYPLNNRDILHTNPGESSSKSLAGG
jgi:hypothetical protein